MWNEECARLSGVVIFRRIQEALPRGVATLKRAQLAKVFYITPPLRHLVELFHHTIPSNIYHSAVSSHYLPLHPDNYSINNQSFQKQQSKSHNAIPNPHRLHFRHFHHGRPNPWTSATIIVQCALLPISATPRQCSHDPTLEFTQYSSQWNNRLDRGPLYERHPILWTKWSES